MFRHPSRQAYTGPTTPYRLPAYAPGVRPKMAMDSQAFPDQVAAAYGWASGANSYHGMWAEGLGFMGYPYLAELSQRSEYFNPCEVLAEEMTRKWIVIKANGDKDLTDKISQLTDAMIRFRLRETFKEAMQLDGIFGLGFVYPDLMMGDQPVSEDLEELQTPLMIDKSKIGKGSLRGFTVVDPTWCSPTGDYDTLNPMSPGFYTPKSWFAMSRRIHTSRFWPIVSRPVPDLLKPAYNFGGYSLIQMLKPYVDNWLRARQSVSDLINAFTVWHLSTDMQAILQGGGSGADMDARLSLFTYMLNNRGIFVSDKQMEEFSNISAPLGGLDKLQAQAQEHMASPARIPLVKLFGITPSGLNPSTDGEVRTFYDSIHGQQEKVLGLPIKLALDIIQLNEFGTIDEDIVFEFNSLWELDEAGESAVRKTDADTDTGYITAGVISPEEVRLRLAEDPSSLYHGLEGPPPEPLMMDDETGEPNQPAGKSAPATNAPAKPGKGDPAGGITGSGARGSTKGANNGV